MSKERLEALKIRLCKAESLATDIAALEGQEFFQGSSNLTHILQCEVYRVGREALLKKKESELESLLAEPEPVMCESLEKFGRCGA